MTHSTNHHELQQQVENLIAELDLRKKQRDMNSEHLGIEAYELAKKSADKSLLIKASTALTHYHTDITSEFDKAIHYLKDTIAQLDDEHDAEAKSEFYRRLGLNRDYIGELIKSKLAYDESVKLLEHRQNISETGFLTLARSLFNESIIYGDLGLVTLKKEYLHRAFSYFQKANYQPGIARCYISFGVVAYDKKDNERALAFYMKAVELAEEINDTPPYCIAMGNSGIIYADMGEYPKAIACINKAIERVRNQTNKHFELSICQLAGRVYQVVKDFDTANQWFAEADRIYKEVGKVVDNSQLFLHWAETLRTLGKHQEAYEKLEKYVEQKEEINKLNKQAQMNDAMFRFEYEEGKKEQELLIKKNAEIEEYARKLEMSNFELNQFAHVASHDMKEPLRMISNYSQLLAKSLDTEIDVEQKDYLHFINEGAKRMMNVIQDLLNLSKINPSQKKNLVKMNEVLNEVKHQLRPLLNERKVQITNDQLPEVLADKVHITQLLQNLIGNAIKYNTSKKPAVEIKYRDLDTTHYFEVADNGIGIEPQYREKVFIIFQRLHNRHEFDGTGIGLAICKKIIDALNGKIWVEDADLGGSKFCFTIPK